MSGPNFVSQTPSFADVLAVDDDKIGLQGFSKPREFLLQGSKADLPDDVAEKEDADHGRYFAVSIARYSRMTDTLICPG